jgi:beta-N-acetylhexosaminidase
VDKTAMVALGNPYLAVDYPETKTYLCTFSHMPTSESAAVKALFGEIPIRGRTPVTIPGLAQRGAGIERNTVARRGRPVIRAAGPGR